MGKKKRELERFPWLKGETLSRDDKAFGTFDLHLARKKGGWISFKFPLVSDDINPVKSKSTWVLKTILFYLNKVIQSKCERSVPFCFDI